MKKNYYLEKLYNSKKPFIVYKVEGGYDLFTDFSKKVYINNKNVKSFFKKFKKVKKNNNFLNLYIGFFGYEILCSLQNVKIPKQKGLNFPKGIFYKPEKIINFKNNINYKSNEDFKNSKFKININKNSYTKIFNSFKKRIKSGETYQIKICTKYKTKSKINPLDFFSRLSKTNLAPEAFMIRDKNYSIISCSPENLITKKGLNISTKPIAGTLKKSKRLNKTRALAFLKKILKKPKNTT